MEDNGKNERRMFIKKKAAERIAAMDKVGAREKAQKAGEAIGNKAMEIRESAMAMKEDINSGTLEHV